MTHDAASERAAVSAWMGTRISELLMTHVDPRFDQATRDEARIRANALISAANAIERLDHHQPTTGREEE